MQTKEPPLDKLQMFVFFGTHCILNAPNCISFVDHLGQNVFSIFSFTFHLIFFFCLVLVCLNKNLNEYNGHLKFSLTNEVFFSCIFSVTRNDICIKRSADKKSCNNYRK